MASIDISGAAGRRAAEAAMIAPVQKVADELVAQIKPLFDLFLNNFTLTSDSMSGTNTTLYYVDAVKEMAATGRTTLNIDYAHVSSHNVYLADAVREHFFRFQPTLDAMVASFVRQHAPDHPELQVSSKSVGGVEVSQFHAALYNLPSVDSIRELKTGRIGELMAISGTVTRTSAVRPELIMATFKCADCGTLNANIPQDFKYTEPMHCLNTACENRTRWLLQQNLSHFGDNQILRLQENSSEIPAGSMPRSVKVVLRHDAVELAKPGDKVVLCGTLIVVPDIAQLSGGAVGARFAKGGARGRTDGQQGGGVTGLKELGVRDLSYSLAFLAVSVRTSSSSFGALHEARLDSAGNPAEDEQFTPAELDRIREMKAQGRVYTRMVASIAPNIFGHEEIKRGILLMLFGGVHKKTADGANLRGDINVCIVGDPSTSKSQFLKYVCTFLPRAVYTSGKASSAAGLTASIARDAETGDFAIEAGALMLADNGICCIDEFDKMDPADQVAIHEAMEQQTISIAKAGIQATLNARTSILAAANPIKGRYDPSRTLKQNVDISAPIMSRFDLFFVVLDEGDQAIDYNIARHIVNVHTGKASATRPEFSMEDLQLYIRFARTIKPKISPEAKADFVQNYVELRGADSTGTNKSAYRITVRQLESMVRLAEARARLDLDSVVTPSHVKEAARLLKKSIVHVENRDVELDDDEGEAFFGEDVGVAGGDDDDNQPPGGDDHDMGGDGAVAATPAAPGGDAMETDEAGSAAPAAAAGADGASVAAKEKKELKLSFTEYQRLTLLIVRFLRSHESAERPSMSWSDLVNAFVAQNLAGPVRGEGEAAGLGDALRSEEELAAHVRTLELVLARLIKVDHILLLLRKSKDKSKRMLKVHPNFTGEDAADVDRAMHPAKRAERLDEEEGLAAAVDQQMLAQQAVGVGAEQSEEDPEAEAARALKAAKSARVEAAIDEEEKSAEVAPATPRSPSARGSTRVTPSKRPAPSSGRSTRSNK